LKLSIVVEQPYIALRSRAAKQPSARRTGNNDRLGSKSREYVA
jgi:hypothetical protein